MQPELTTERVEYILKHMEDAVCLTGMKGELLYANSAAKRLFGSDFSERKRIWEAIPFVEGNDPLIQLFIDGIMQKKKTLRSLVKYVNRDGREFNLHVTLICESEDAGMFLVVIHDLTDLTKVHSAFERYTSPEIADFVLTTPEGQKQGGQDRDVSILMSDLRGFTAMSGRLSSTELIDVLNHYFESMAAVITRYRGTVIEFLGDGIFVVFGAPLDLPDHAEAAVSCAVEMQNAMAGVNAWNREHGYPMLEMGIGINSGTVVAGNIGSDRKMKYGCMGETVNLAGRLESLCLGGQIYISEVTRKRISEPLKITGEKAFMPKGSRNRMTVYCIAGIGEICYPDDSSGEIRWRNLPEPRELFCYILDGKTVEPEPHAGSLTDLSEDERFGLLVTGCSLHPLQNLMLRIGNLDVYAMVTDCSGKEYRIGFTAKPDGFSDLFS